MKKQGWYIALAVLFAVLMIGAAVAYNALSEQVLPEDTTPTEPPTGTTSPTALQAATDFTVYGRDGEAVTLSSLFGKPIVLNFWATWCGYCVEELPAFEEMAATHGDGVAFMMINVPDERETSERVERFLEAGDYTFPVYYDTAYEASRAYGAYSIPLTVFINADGRVAYVRRGAMNAAQLAMYMESFFGVS